MKKSILFLGVLLVSIALSAVSCKPTADNTATNTTNPPAVSQNNTTPPQANTVTPTTPTPVAKTVVVKYTGSAFSPSSVTINVGDTVRFENTGQTAAVWPAANPHPLHTSVSGFDAKQPLDTGGHYSFTFTKAGTVGYHNHLNPVQTGTIIVK